jgi:hypothetical protein
VADRAAITGVAIAVTGDDAGQQRATDERLATLGLTERAERITDAATPFAAARIAGLLAAPRIAAHDMLVASVVRDLERALPAEGGDEPAERATPTDRLPPPSIGRLAAARDIAGLRESLVIARPGSALLRTRGEELRDVLEAIRVEKPVPTEITEAEVLAVAGAYAAPRLGEGLERLAAAPASLPTADQVWIADEGKVVELDAVLRAVEPTGLPRFAERLGKVAASRDAAALARLISAEG